MTTLRKAGREDAPALWDLQKRAFAALLEKYRDYGTNPASEPLSHIQWRLESPDREYWFILSDQEPAGLICVKRTERGLCVSPIGLLSQYQGRGVGHAAMELLEKQYPHSSRWELGTIQEEPGLCSFYESLGYRRAGRITPIQPGMNVVGFEKRI